MSSLRYPPKGARARRKADGLAGAVFVSSPKTDLVAVRWKRGDKTGTLLYDAERFANEWEVVNASGATWGMRTWSNCVGGDGGDRDLLRGDGVEVICSEPKRRCGSAEGERGDGWKESARRRRQRRSFGGAGVGGWGVRGRRGCVCAIDCEERLHMGGRHNAG